MAILILTPREYYDMTWNLVVSNKLDTVSGNAIINRVDVEPTEFYTTTTTKGTLRNGTEVNFPLDETDNTSPDEWIYEGLDHKMFWGGSVWNASRARQEFVWATGKVHIAPDVPIEGQPTLTMELRGNTYKMKYMNSDSNIDTDKIPGKDAMKGSASVCSWIKDNMPESSMERLEGQWFNYDSGKVNIIRTGCVKENAPYDPNANSEQWMRNWCFMYMGDVEGTIEHASNFDWKPWANVGLWGNKYYVSYDYAYPRATLKQVGVREYEIDWSAPIKVVGLGASRKDNFWGQPGDQVGSAAYVNYLTSIQFSLSARPFNTEKSPFAWSMKPNGELTADLSNIYPLTLGEAEVITLNTTMNDKLWTEEMPRTLMTKYKDGKYYVQTKVNAKWLIDNDVHINTLMEIVNITGQKINRKGVPCTFAVKNIAKEYTDSAFTYTLSCLEV